MDKQIRPFGMRDKIGYTQIQCTAHRIVSMF